jgi:hypothetical protein
VEFVHFRRIDNSAQDKVEEYYAAYIMLPDGALCWALLGPAETIERAVAAWRQALDLQSQAAPGRAPADWRKLARLVDELVMQPVRAHLGNVRQVFLAPDGALNLLPFAALIDEHGRELVRDYLLIYLPEACAYFREGCANGRNPGAL